MSRVEDDMRVAAEKAALRVLDWNFGRLDTATVAKAIAEGMFAAHATWVVEQERLEARRGRYPNGMV